MWTYHLLDINVASSSRRGRQLQPGRGRCSLSGVCSASSRLLLLFLLLATLQRDELVHGEPSQQQQQPQQRGNGQSNELGQEFSSGGSGLADGLATLNGYGRGAYTNAKRARGKMSAFMPMRGRKDGRDLVGVDSLRGVAIPPAAEFYQQRQQPLSDKAGLAGGQPQFVRELDPNDDASLARLISGAAAAAAPGGDYQRYYLRDNATPRQFYNQFQSASAQQLAGDDARREQLVTAGQPVRPVGGGGGGQRQAFSLEQADPAAAAAGGTNQIMQAKLRRAFHPMRGKKSLLDQWGLGFEGLALPDETQQS